MLKIKIITVSNNKVKPEPYIPIGSKTVLRYINFIYFITLKIKILKIIGENTNLSLGEKAGIRSNLFESGIEIWRMRADC